jgi:hypothetical protein
MVVKLSRVKVGASLFYDVRAGRVADRGESPTLTLFGVNNVSIRYLVLNNASNNNTAVKSLTEEFSFIASERRLRCCCYILNLGAQLVIWGKDRSAYKNNAAHLKDEEKYIDK